MIEALNSPVIQIDSLKTKFDTTVVSNSLIALLDYSYEEARFLQQLHYWSYSKYGVVIDGVRWIYKSVREWLSEVLAGMSEWKLRKTIASLLSKGLIRREKLYVRHHEQEYQSPWWNPKNQTYYYSINYEELQELIASAEVGKTVTSTENVRFEDFTELSIEEIKKTKYCGLSQNKSENINHRKILTKQSDHLTIEDSNNTAAAFPKITLRREKKPEGNNSSNSQLSAVPEKTNNNLSSLSQGDQEDKSSAQIEQIVNLHWKKSIADLDAAGIPVNKTLRDLLKLYSKEKVDSAIALLKARKREQYIPNSAGYFVAALKGDWGNSLIGDKDEEVDTISIFRHWYDLANELGYCSGQEVRDGEQWVNLGGWEKWSAAVERGYSLDYLKKILKRNKG
ncbi:MAG: hypothetical protein AAFR77_14980 [Cyanobacteria bacterium J06631_2]